MRRNKELEEKWGELKELTQKTYSVEDLPRLERLIKKSHKKKSEDESFESLISRMNDEMLDIRNSRHISFNKMELLDKMKIFLEQEVVGCNIIFMERKTADNFDSMISAHLDYFEQIVSNVNEIENFHITNDLGNISYEDNGDYIEIRNRNSNDIIFNYARLRHIASYEIHGSINQSSHIDFNVKNNYLIRLTKYDFGGDGEEKRYIPFLDKTLNYWDLKRNIEQIIRQEKLKLVFS